MYKTNYTIEKIKIAKKWPAFNSMDGNKNFYGKKDVVNVPEIRITRPKVPRRGSNYGRISDNKPKIRSS